MAPQSTFVFSSPLSLELAFVLVGLIAVIAIVRRIDFGWWAGLLVILALILLALAAGLPVWNRPGDGSVVVMVDLSPSTRGATFRDRAALELRVGQLLGSRPHQSIAFSDRNRPLALGDPLADLPAEQTVFSPPSADAVLLFSDGRFELPADAPPTFPVIDPMLNHPVDAAVTALKEPGSRVLAMVKNDDANRVLHWTGGKVDPLQPLLATPTDASQISAGFAPGDRWPENDTLTLHLAPPAEAQNWWVGSSAPAGWRGISAWALPTESSEFLQPAVIVLNNISADSLSSAQQQKLLQYVRDLGGALLIVGGDHAFAAGGYDGSLLENLSPLASSPPLPAQRWLLLIDGSGSMAGAPWETEIAAITHLIPLLPPRDSVMLGSFARTLTWWSNDRSIAVPANIFPTGPTNLAAALRQITNTTDGSSPAQVLLITDAETELVEPASLARDLSARKIHLHLLAIGHGGALRALAAIAKATGGSVLEQVDPQQWIASTRQLLRTALPDHIQHTTVAVTPAPPAMVSNWNQTWLKQSATAIQQSPLAPMAGRWQLGLGQVIALAYPAEPTIALEFAKQIANVPHDPRFKVSWDAGASFRVWVDAVDGKQYLNGESISLEAGGTTTALPQTAPGLYEITLPASRVPVIVTVREQNRVLERFAVAGRYAPEFEEIGNDLGNLKLLADRTGGSVIEPGPVHPIDFHWPTRATPLSSWLAFAGFVLGSAGMMWNKRFGSGLN